MNKLLNLKKNLTIKEAAKLLSEKISEEVGEKDIYGLVLDGHLKISIEFISDSFAKRHELTSGKGIPIPTNSDQSIHSSDAPRRIGVIDFPETSDDNEVLISGTCDLQIMGAGELWIKQCRQTAIGAPDITLATFESVYVTSPEAGDQYIFELIDESEGSYPGKIPDDVNLVIRTSEIQNLAEKLLNSGEIKPKPLSGKTENAYLRLIRYLLNYFIGGLTGQPAADATTVHEKMVGIAGKPLDRRKDICSSEPPVCERFIAETIKKTEDI